MIFGFFSRWKKAGRAVGISNGSGKLCMFDKDGNVISSGIDPESVSSHLYRHDIHWTASDDADTTFDIYGVLYTTSSTALTGSTFYTALPAHNKNPLSVSGWATAPVYSEIGPAYAVGKASESNKIGIYAMLEGDLTELDVSKTFGSFSDNVTTVY